MALGYSNTERVYDELLLRRVQAGDRRAGERLAARWYPRLMRTAYRLLRDEEQARVVVQESWTGICASWRKLRDPSRFPAWAYTILHRKCADQIRTSQRLRGLTSSGAEMTEASIGPRGEDKVSIDQAFDQLSEAQRSVATLYFGAGLTVKEIAQVTGIPVGTAKSRLFHARRHLMAALGDGPNDEGE